MMIMKLSLLTCAFYLGICGILELAIFIAIRFRWANMIGAKGIGMFAVFGTIWLISFYAAARILAASMRASFPH